MGNETKTVISVECIDQTLRMTQAPTIASGGVKENAVEFTFGALWDDLILFAVFYRKPSEVYHVRIEDGRCIVPREVTRNPGCFFLGVMGAKDGVTRTSTVLSYRVEAGAITDGIEPPEPTPSIYAQILASVQFTEQIAQSVRDDADAGKFDGAKGDKGDKGDKCDKGDPGANGAPGKDGSDATVTAQNIEAALGYAPVKDVQVAGTSVMTDGVANVPIATKLLNGVMRPDFYGIGVSATGILYVQNTSNINITNRVSSTPLTAYNLDYAVKAAMCDGKGTAWTADEQKAARERMGIPGGYELIEEITIAEGNVSVITRDVDRLCSAKLVIICPPMESIITANALIYFGDASKPEYIYLFGEIAPTKVGVYRHITLEAELRNNYWRAYKTAENGTGNMYPNGSLTTSIVETAPSRLMQLPSSNLDAITKITLNAFPTGAYIPVGTKIMIYGVRA